MGQGKGGRARGSTIRAPWWQALIVLCAVGVIAAMVYIAETAQREAEHHRQVQVMFERVRAASEQIAAIVWRGAAETTPGAPQSVSPIVAQGFSVFSKFGQSLKILSAEDAGPMVTELQRDAGALYASGARAIQLSDKPHSVLLIARAMQGPLAALASDADRAAAEQEKVAAASQDRERMAYMVSLAAGLAVLLLIGLGLHRMRRAALLGEARRELERRGEERLRVLIEHSSDIIAVVDEQLIVRWQSASIRQVLGIEAEDLIGRRLCELAHPDDALLVESHVAMGLTKSGPTTFSARFRTAEGEWRYLEAISENRLADASVQGVVLSMRDITERKALEEELRHQAFHDALTGLANRALFEDRLAHALAGARRHGRSVAVLFLDLDDFKTINDSLGHASGDELLRAVAIRIAGVVRATDTAARLGGDEFAVLLETVEEDGDGEVIAARLLDALRPGFEISGRELRVTASVGLAESDGSTGLEELLRNADTAMYAAKGAGKGVTQAFERGMHERVLDRLELTAELRRGLETRQFELDYQPIVDLHHGTILGAEALVRWANPARGRLAPGAFIGLAEETGLIVPLGEWILRTACAQGAAWDAEFPGRELYMTVNVSTRQLHDPGFPDTVADALADSGLCANQLVLEITESLLPDDSHEIIEQLHRLKELGVRVAVDDFGTGYSALSRLQAYPVDILKIDRSFIDGMESDAGKRQLVRGIVNLGESLRLAVVAEGIEEREQADELRRMNSPLGQGYLFSRPVASEQLSALLRQDKPLTAPEAPLPL